LNTYYFLGEPYDTAPYAEGITLWRTQKDDFTLKYIESMLKESSIDNQTATIDLQ